MAQYLAQSRSKRSGSSLPSPSFLLLLGWPTDPQSPDTVGITQKVDNHFRVWDSGSSPHLFSEWWNSQTLVPVNLLISLLLIMFTDCFLVKWDGPCKIRSMTFAFLECKGKGTHFMGKGASRIMFSKCCVCSGYYAQHWGYSHGHDRQN